MSLIRNMGERVHLNHMMIQTRVALVLHKTMPKENTMLIQMGRDFVRQKPMSKEGSLLH